MVLAEGALSRVEVAGIEGPGEPLSERQLTILQIIKSAIAHPLTPIGDGRPMNGPDALLEAFNASNVFDRLYSEAEREALFGDPGEATTDFRGALVEELGTMYVANQEHSGLILLGGETPFRVVQALNPASRIIHHPYGHDGVADNYVPDVLAVKKQEDGKIVVVGGYEMSIVNRYEKYMGQIHGLSRTLEKLGPLAAAGFFSIVMLSGRNSDRTFIGKASGIRVETLHMPITFEELERCYQDMAHFYRRTPEHPTIAELQIQGSERARKIRKIGEPAFFRLREEAAREVARAEAEKKAA